MLSFRESTDPEKWDSVRFVVRGSSDLGSLRAMLWSATELLNEIELSAVDGEFQGEFLAPADQDVWVGVEGVGTWALSSVHAASFVPEANCTGLSESDAVFDGNAL